MSNKDTGGPAFPCENASEWTDGMTLRDYFAGIALQGLLTNEFLVDVVMHTASEQCLKADKLMAEGAYVIADNMLAERNK